MTPMIAYLARFCGTSVGKADVKWIMIMRARTEILVTILTSMLIVFAALLFGDKQD